MPTPKKSSVRTKTLEEYLKKCPNNMDKYDFENSKDAYEFGHKLREIALQEEGVFRPDQMEKFNVEISYKTVRIRYTAEQLAAKC